MVISSARVRGLAFFLAIVGNLGGCTSTTPRTEVLVVIDTDLRGPSAIDNLHVEVTSPSGIRQTSVATLGDGQPSLPRSIGLVWDAGPLGPFTVRVAGNTGGMQRVERVARFEFQRNQTVILQMHLLAACERASCGAAETCGESGCRSIDVPPAELLPYGGVLPGLDGAAPAGDGGIDASVSDAGPVDAAPFDAFVTGDACTPVAEACNMRDDDCDGSTDEDFVLDTDTMNCGACGHACAFANATGSCVGGACVITACTAGFDDCNALGDDGCEIDLVNDPDHCGSCAMVCVAPDRACCAMACARRCP